MTHTAEQVAAAVRGGEAQVLDVHESTDNPGSARVQLVAMPDGTRWVLYIDGAVTELCDANDGESIADVCCEWCDNNAWDAGEVPELVLRCACLSRIPADSPLYIIDGRNVVGLDDAVRLTAGHVHFADEIDVDDELEAVRREQVRANMDGIRTTRRSHDYLVDELCA